MLVIIEFVVSYIEISKTSKDVFRFTTLLEVYQGYVIGKLNENLAPTPFWLFSAHIFPPCDSIMLLEMNNPNPVPNSAFEVNL